MKKAPTAEKLQKILNTYPELNEKWLLSGEGNMLKDPANKTDTGQAMPTVPAIPLIPISAIAGFGKENPTTLEYEGERYIIPAFKEAEFLIQVKGSSMYPNYSNGDIVACKKLPIDTFFQWNRVYVLDTEQGALTKRAKDSSKKDTLLIVSDNPAQSPIQTMNPLSSTGSISSPSPWWSVSSTSSKTHKKNSLTAFATKELKRRDDRI